MIGILQRYIAKELLKTFALATVGLTLTFSLCGGVMNMVQAEVLTGVQIARMMAFVLPIATTLTLPVAAIFACANVYGRLAADNEFDACKASGINIHHLLAPAVALSIFTFAFTFAFTNFVIPSFVERLEAMVRKDIQKLILQALATQGYIKRGPYVLYAGRSQPLFKEGETEVMHLRHAAFLELESDILTRCGTANEVRVDFHEATSEGDPVVEAVMYGIKAFDIERNQVYELGEQPFDPVVITSRVEQEPKWLTLPQLIYFSRHPTKLSSVQEQAGRVRALVREAIFYKHAIQQLTTGDKVLKLEDKAEDLRYEIRATTVTPAFPDPALEDFRPRLEWVTVNEWRDGTEWRYSARWCAMKAKYDFRRRVDLVSLVLEENVRFLDTSIPDNEVTSRRKELIDIPVPAAVYAEAKEISDDELMCKGLGPYDEPEPLNLGLRIQDMRARAHKELIKLGLEIRSIIHSRLSYSAGVFVLLVLAAALGIIFRGGQLLTAFVIAFVPALLVVVMNIMGRQLAENAGTAFVGILVMWAGILLVALADGVVLTRYLKR